MKAVRSSVVLSCSALPVVMFQRGMKAVERSPRQGGQKWNDILGKAKLLTSDWENQRGMVYKVPFLSPGPERGPLLESRVMLP